MVLKSSKIADIETGVGIVDQSHFSMIVKKIVGISPGY
jgi:hypothetical protein